MEYLFNRLTLLYSKIYYKEENYLKVKIAVFKYITPPIIKVEYISIFLYSYILTFSHSELFVMYFVTEPHRRGLYRRAPCSRVHLAYSLRQLRVGISPPYALNPYDRLRNVL